MAGSHVSIPRVQTCVEPDLSTGEDARGEHVPVVSSIINRFLRFLPLSDRVKDGTPLGGEVGGEGKFNPT